FFFSSRRRHMRFSRDWCSDACSSDLGTEEPAGLAVAAPVQVVVLAATVYVRGADATDVRTRLEAAWEDFLVEIPLGGFDLSPGQIGRASCRERGEAARAARAAGATAP